MRTAEDFAKEGWRKGVMHIAMSGLPSPEAVSFIRAVQADALRAAAEVAGEYIRSIGDYSSENRADETETRILALIPKEKQT